MSYDKARERLAAATQTEWKAASGRGKVSILGTTDENGRSYQIAVFAAIPTTHRKADVELCAHCPTDLAAALDVIEAARVIDPGCVNFPDDSYVNCYEVDAKNSPWLTFPCLHCALGRIEALP